MYGLLGTDFDDPKTQGILGLAMGLLSGSGPSPVRQNFGSILGNAGMAGMQQYRIANELSQRQKDREEDRKIRQMKIDELTEAKRAQQEGEARLREYLGTVGQPDYPMGATVMTDRGRELMAGAPVKQFDPLAAYRAGVPLPMVSAAQGMMPKPKAPLVTKPGDVLRSADDPTKIVAQNPAEPKDYSNSLLIPDGKGGYTVNQALLNARQQIARAGASNVTVTTGQREVDKKFAGDFVDFATGGYADVQKQLTQLQQARRQLSSGRTISGPVIGAMPDSLLAFTNPEAVATKEKIQEVAQRNLRLVLGAQFTEKEGERLIARVFNPRLGEAENLRRLDLLIKQIADAAESKRSASEYFRQNGTLNGWPGKLPTFADFDVETEVDQGGWSMKRK